MANGTLVLVNPPASRKGTKMARKTAKKSTARKSVRRGGSKASRSAAAKKAAATRKRNAAKRSAAGKKAAATRKRNASKRSSAAKKAAATRKRKTTTTKRKTTKGKTTKTSRSAAAKKGWRTRRAASTKRSNAAKRAARSRKSPKKTTKRASTKKKSAGRMTKAKRSAAAKKGWRTRRGTSTRRKSTKRTSTKRRASRRTVKAGTVALGDAIPTKLDPVGGLMAFGKSLSSSVMNPGKQVDALMASSKYALAGMGMMGLLAVAKGNVWNRIGVTSMVDSAVGGIDYVGPDLVNAFDAMLDMATVGALGALMSKQGIPKKFLGPAMTATSLIIAADFIRNIEAGGIGDKASDLASGSIFATSLSSLTSTLSNSLSGTSLGGLGMTQNNAMFGMHNQAPAMGMAHGNNNLALAMSPNNTAATGNAKFFGTKSLGSTRVNLF